MSLSPTDHMNSMPLYFHHLSHRQLTDKRFYQELDSDITEEFSALITDILDEIYKNDEIVTMSTICSAELTFKQAYLICFPKFTRKECLDTQ